MVQSSTRYSSEEYYGFIQLPYNTNSFPLAIDTKEAVAMIASDLKTASVLSSLLKLHLLFLNTASAFADDSPTLHPKALALSFSHQGPFVTTTDGGVICMDSKSALHSNDEGRRWKSTPLFAEAEKFNVSNERALLRTREGVVISAWMNGTERKAPNGWRWGDKNVSWKEFVLPTYTCRSVDDGKTWDSPVKLSDPWCGCIHSLIQMKNGRIVLVGQEIISNWRHATVMWVSDDAMLTDGMHPAELGHLLVAELLFPVIRDSLR